MANKIGRRGFLGKLLGAGAAVAATAVSPLPQMPKEPKGKLIIDARKTLPVLKLQVNYATGNWYNVQAVCTEHPGTSLIGTSIQASVEFTTPLSASSGRGYIRSVEPVKVEGRQLYKVKLYVRDWAESRSNG